MLLVVQLGALTHALAHDVGTAQDQVCFSCLATQPSGDAPIGSTWSLPAEPAGASRIDIPTIPIHSLSVPFARQRAPPSSD